MTGLNQELTERRETAEAKFWFAVGLIRHIVVEVVACEACRLVEIAIGKRLADFGEHAGCGHIDIPIVGRAFAVPLSAPRPVPGPPRQRVFSLSV